MAYTEIKERNKNKYYYRVQSIRKGNKVTKKREYLGSNLLKSILIKKEQEADTKMLINKELVQIVPKIRKILIKYGVSRAGIFGSYAKGNQRKRSDIDIIIQPPKGIGFGFSGIADDLKYALKKEVDLVSYNGLSPYIKDQILQNEVKIL